MDSRVDRRSFVRNALGTVIVSHLAGSPPSYAMALQTSDSVNVADRFGFVGDGRTDNYEAFHRWADYVNQARGGNYLFPPGTYYVRRYRTAASMKLDPAAAFNSTIRGCDGLTISGYGAKIVLNGNFHRSEGAGKFNMAFMPFEFARCRNVRIAGFDIDGGVRGMTRDKSVTEIYSHLIALNGCSEVWLQDLDLHHSQTDGLYLYQDGFKAGSHAGVACKNVTLKNVKCHNNARGGLAPLQVYGLSCSDCSFSGNGTGLGKYFAHAPGFGVDVEPDYYESEAVDVRTGNLEFRRCEFNDNVSAFLAAYSRRYQGYLRLIDCRSANGHNHPHHIIINWRGALLEGGLHDAGAGTVWTSWEGERDGDLTIRNCQIRTSALYGVFHSSPDNAVHLEGVKIIGTHSGPAPNGWVLSIQAVPAGGKRNSMKNCEIFVPAARKSTDHPYDYEVSLRHVVSDGNLFRTNLSARGGQHFCTEYGTGAIARGDRYSGTAPGPEDSFRPAHMSTFDTRRPFSQG